MIMPIVLLAMFTVFFLAGARFVHKLNIMLKLRLEEVVRHDEAKKSLQEKQTEARAETDRLADRVPVFMADGTTQIPGAFELHGEYHIRVDKANVDYVTNNKRNAIAKSKKLYPAEWNKILAPKPEEVKQAVDDLRNWEGELEDET